MAGRMSYTRPVAENFHHSRRAIRVACPTEFDENIVVGCFPAIKIENCRGITCIKPEIGQVLPMECAEEALRAMWEGKTDGKAVFTR
jgi:hypothetical protein